MNGWMAQQLMEARQKDLLATAQRSHRAAERHVVADLSLPLAAIAQQPELQSVQAARPHHRPAGKLIGEWLIRAGTRLGGASMQAS
jgi:hypothetical protein